VKKPRLLPQSEQKSKLSRSENLKKVRRQTDQKLKQQNVQQESAAEAEKKNQSS
jgi:hypothetical protein